MLRHCTGHAATRYRALILFGWAGALRRSELVAVNTSDVTIGDLGAELYLRRSKTDQNAEGAAVALPHGAHPQTCPVNALVTLMNTERLPDNITPTPDGPLFRTIDRHGNPGIRLTDQAVGHILKRHADNAGIGPPRAETPLFPYGTMLADINGYRYDTDGAAVTIRGRHVTAAELDAAADDCETGL